MKSLNWRDPICAKGLFQLVMIFLTLFTVADLGLAKELVTESFKGTRAADRAVANPTWLAPEILSGKSFGLPSDVYAYGIMLWELLVREHPYESYQFDSDKEAAVINGIRPPIAETCPQQYATLMKYDLSEGRG